MVDSTSSTIPQSLAGRLLIATPQLHSGLFFRTVIYLQEHSPELGALGLIINQPSNQSVGEILYDHKESHLSELPIHIGGPVEMDHIVFHALQRSDGSIRLESELTESQIEAAGLTPESRLIAAAGYASWEPLQLEDEIQQESWFHFPISQTILTAPLNQTLWKKLLMEQSALHQMIAQHPSHPEWN